LYDDILYTLTLYTLIRHTYIHTYIQHTTHVPPAVTVEAEPDETYACMVFELAHIQVLVEAQVKESRLEHAKAVLDPPLSVFELKVRIMCEIAGE
jgi:hypothetical protein